MNKTTVYIFLVLIGSLHILTTIRLHNAEFRIKELQSNQYEIIQFIGQANDNTMGVKLYDNRTKV